MPRWCSLVAALALWTGCGDDEGGTPQSGSSSGGTSAALSTSTGATEGASSSSSTGGSDSSEGGSTTGGEAAEAPELLCPNPDEPACVSNEGPLRAAAAVRSIVPSCFEAWIDQDNDAVFDATDVHLDCGCDRLCPDDAG
jgi:hypothetical protein